MDTFDTSTNSLDINFENDKRQSGTAGILKYVEAYVPESGVQDDQTQVNNPQQPNKLYLVNVANGVSPDYNFIDGTEFAIECEVTAGANNPARDSENWAAIVFGSTGVNRYVSSEDGMGISFRNDGRIEVWDGQSRVYGSDLADALPAGPLKVRIEAKTSNFQGGSPATINLFVNDQPIRITSNTVAYVKPSGFRGNYITLLGIGAGLVHTFDDLKVTALAEVHSMTQSLTFGPGETSKDIVIKIPEAMNRDNDAVIRLTSRNPTIANAERAIGGVLIMDFPIGSPITQTITIKAVNKGRTFFTLSDNAEVAVGDPMSVSILTSLVQNPSFELSYQPVSPHYGWPDFWIAYGSYVGVNRADGPFQNNGLVPDRSQVAFIQGQATAGLEQIINGLVPGKKYWLQFRYNAVECCPSLSIRFDRNELDRMDSIQPVGGTNAYYFRNVSFVPQMSSTLLEFGSIAASLIDAVTIIQRDEGNVVVQNPSFEASGLPQSPGMISPDPISGWDGTGSYGVNFSGDGPFADNGTAPDQDLVAFLQGQGTSLSQLIGDLTAGQRYSLSYACNARLGNTPHLKVTIGTVSAQDEDVSAVGGSNPYHLRSFAFTAENDTANLVFTQTAAGDNTVLLDNVAIQTGEETLRVRITIQSAENGVMRLLWPTSAIGFQLQSASSATGPWITNSLPVSAEGDQNVVSDTIGSAALFYRLAKD
ncbi:MAG: hypothetical protein DME19_13550 [Verrucomicrobia bacterium]|nr:MAG: hypothetical protein DME19_13550 [Verrucomicrobiota bacterium]